ncbi:hypothetical protein HK099_002195 [Clydaea vesicula]|uniref:Uncharacterized protein n=1 Tax=Clydaea vesicula TaxID=447962 RepID=A0AAD5TTI5_9FUNG|nr:hypothetical protein HK099_002195 [Clydaea vesicula]KAJ3397594.1 hypothetical protein HDU92_006389 [Lobulomyces angularis]
MENLIIPWSENPTEEELKYKANVYFVRTIGTCFDIPIPTECELRSSFQNQPNPNSNLSVGARALTKHFVRKTKDKKVKSVNEKHQFWQEPIGSEKNKNLIALQHLEYFLTNSTWKNLHIITNQTTVFEMRVKEMYGMRWFFLDEKWQFRGYLEPY